MSSAKLGLVIESFYAWTSIASTDVELILKGELVVVTGRTVTLKGPMRKAAVEVRELLTSAGLHRWVVVPTLDALVRVVS